MIDYLKTVEKWCIQELRTEGPSDGNPFMDYEIAAEFKSKSESASVRGFYDGDGKYCVRFMPSFEEEYSFRLTSNFTEGEQTGSFTVTPAAPGNHGPVRVCGTYHFAYEDATPYYSIGTTCYAWTHQPQEIQAKTLETLKNNVFNKIRFCIFPKHYVYNENEPITYPFEKKADGSWDFTRLNPEHFRLIENRISDLRDMGIEADLILFHPYDRWGFSKMDPEMDDFYLRYVIARYAAYRNVWWSLANEYDIMTKTTADWERFAAILCREDPVSHLRSIHNCIHFYDHSRPWVTHASVQRTDNFKTTEYTDEWRRRWNKPVVIDEMVYEGNLDKDWGNITGEETVRRFWEAVLRGGYPGHGETYLDPDDVIWWAKGGELHGSSPERFKFLYKILCETPGHGLTAGNNSPFMPISFRSVKAEPEDRRYKGKYFIYYYGFTQPAFASFHIDDETEFQVEILDTWNMTITDGGVHKGAFRIELPGRQYMAVRLKATDLK